MDFNRLKEKVIEMAQDMKDAQHLSLPQLIESKALRFVDDNFQNQGWEGQSWKPNDRHGTILIMSGALRRGFESTVSQDQVRIFNEIKYAFVHNEGFDGEVVVPGHDRGQYKQVGSGKFTKKGKERLVLKRIGTGRVKTYSRRMKLPKRQFAPTDASPSPTLDGIVKATIASEVLRLMNKP